MNNQTDTLLFLHNENAIFPADGKGERKETKEKQHFTD